LTVDGILFIAPAVFYQLKFSNIIKPFFKMVRKDRSFGMKLEK